MIYWQLLKRVQLKHLSYIAVVVLLITTINRQAELHTARVALKNPKIVEVVKYTRVEGPVRIVTRVIEKPTGERETTTTEDRGETIESNLRDTKKEPINLAQVLPSQNRWLVGISNRNLAFKDFGSYGVWGGYSWNNTADALAGYEHRESGSGYRLLGVWRFR